MLRPQPGANETVPILACHKIAIFLVMDNVVGKGIVAIDGDLATESLCTRIAQFALDIFHNCGSMLTIITQRVGVYWKTIRYAG